MEKINRTGRLNCPHCSVDVYEVYPPRQFVSGDLISSKDFRPLQNFPAPQESTPMNCPNCGKSMVEVIKG